MGSFGGSLRGWSTRDLGGAIIKEALARARVEPGMVDEVIMGNVNPPASCLNVGKEAALKADVPVHVPGFSVNRLCGSSLQAINVASMMIMCQQADIVVAGGVENMSDYPYAVFDVRWGKRMGDAIMVDEASESMKDPGTGILAGYTAELLAEKYNISREEQDQFALESQLKAKKAIESGAFEAEILPLEIKTRKGTKVFAVDEHPKFDSSLEKLARLATVFKPNGTVTAGNACGMNDGASALLLMSAGKARELGLPPMARVVGFAAGSVEPLYFGEAPVVAVKKALDRTGLSLAEMELIECNEAFAAQTIAVERGLQWERQRLNVNGGAIALGHPLGATGGKLTTTLIHELKRRQGRYGVVTACTGGGMAVATIIENV